MKTASDTTASMIDSIPSPALANTRRDTSTLIQAPVGMDTGRLSFEHRLRSTWHLAARQGFTPGQEREYLLEAAFKRSPKRNTRPSDG